MPSFGACTRQGLEQLWREGRTTFHMRDKSTVRLVKLEQLASDAAGDEKEAKGEDLVSALTELCLTNSRAEVVDHESWSSIADGLVSSA